MHVIVSRPAALLASTVLVLSACTSGAAEPAAGPSTSSSASAPAPAPSDSRTPSSSPSAQEEAGSTTELTGPIRRLEAEYAAAVGLYAVDTATGDTVTYGADRRLAFASTYKALAAGAVIERSNPEELDRVVTYDADDLVEYSPVTEQHVGEGMPMSEIIDAAVQESDNTAGNLLFDALGGPSGFEDALRAIGDETTVSERREPELNEVVPGDDRDTSTARALAEDLRAYVLGDVLDGAGRTVLVEALQGSTTGSETIRAGVPDGWTVGNKTGTSGHGARNDIGVLWPPDGDPIVLAVLTQTEDPDAEPDDALLAEATRVAVEALSG